MKFDRQLIFVCLIGFSISLVACGNAEEEMDTSSFPPQMQAIMTVDDGPDDIFIRVSSELDDPRHYCLDIPNNDMNPLGIEMFLHTCKEGIRHRDAIFSAARTEESEIFMPDYDLCLEATSVEPGSTVRLANCTGDVTQEWDFSDATIKPVANIDLCLTVSPDAGELTGGGRLFPTRYKSRDIYLQTCATSPTDDVVSRQKWDLAKPRRDLEAPILPNGSLADWAEFAEIMSNLPPPGR